MPYPIDSSCYWIPSVESLEYLPDDQPDGTVCLVEDERLAMAMAGSRWYPLSLVSAPQPTFGEHVRHPVVCGNCGAPVSPRADRCDYCGAWFR